MKHLSVNGLSLEYRWFGQPSPNRPTLVFLHEGLGTVSLWRDFPAVLAEATGCPAFAYTRQGYGGSDTITLPRPLDYLDREALDVLPGVLNAVGIGKAILIGHSDGATIALIQAGQGRDERVSGIVCEAPHVFVEDMCVTGIERAVEAWRTTDLRSRLARHHHDNVDVAFRGWSERWLSPEFRGWSIEELLPRIVCPVQLIQGLDDEYATPRQIEAIAEGVAGPVESLLLPACAHTPHRDQREVVLAAMTRFVKGIAG